MTELSTAPAIGTIDGTDLVPIRKNATGGLYKMTMAALASFVGGGGGGGGGLTLLDSKVCTSGDTTKTFTGIDGSYKDLILVFHGTVNGSNVNILGQFNSDTGSNYNYEIDSRFEYTPAFSATAMLIAVISGTGLTGGVEEYFEHTVYNYASSKSKITHGTSIGFGGGNFFTRQFHNMWTGTSSLNPVTALALSVSTGSFAAGTIYLYGRR